MSYTEAQRDGIRTVQEKGQTIYYPRCQFCGAEVRSWNYLPRNRYTCEACRPFKALF
ncbi:MAG: hypothetical protein VB065_00180 [Eubacteriales bacterium]|nr:hypothetical protein [Eubacteriales bacterium]